MSNKPEERDAEKDAEKTDLTYMGNAPPEAGEDIYSYKNILLTPTKWAWPSSGWLMVGGWLIVAFACVGCIMLITVINRGWDGLFTMLGWK